jgi:hypothetical protein
VKKVGRLVDMLAMMLLEDESVFLNMMEQRLVEGLVNGLE